MELAMPLPHKGGNMPRRSYRKNDVETRYIGRYNEACPAINVKVYSWPHTARIAEHFKCSHDVAEKAAEYAFEMARDVFWEDIQETAEHYLGAGVTVQQGGRSGGWLVVEGLPDVETWDAIVLSKWGRFERAVKAEINDRLQWDNIAEDIEANQWAVEGAERFNFIDTASGVKTVPELKQHMAKAKADFLNA